MGKRHLAVFCALGAAVSAAAAQDPAAQDPIVGSRDGPGTGSMADISHAMLQAAAETGDASQVDAVENALFRIYPARKSEITKIAARWRAAVMITNGTAEPGAAGLRQATDQTGAERAPGAQQAPAQAAAPWKGKIVASFANASGNAENTTVGFALNAERKAGALTHSVTGFFDIASANGAQTQQRWGAGYQLDYDIGERSYGFARANYEEDAFSGFDYRLFGGVGAGYFIRNSDQLTWKVEGGPGYRYSPVDDTREVQSEVAFYAANETDWTIREGVVFEQDVFITWTNPTTTIQSVTGLTAALTNAISAGVSYDVRYETNPPAGRVNTDTVLRGNLSYGF
ncbi:MAG: DUF481 domain-containing protein [Pseudomonadota bacterium]